MSYIDKPNLKGLACDFKPMALSQPYTNLKVPPNMPNYGLGALKNSPYDTIGKIKDTVAVPTQWVLYPNPVGNTLNIKIPNSKVGDEITILVYNMLGQIVLQQRHKINLIYEVQLSTIGLASNLYLLKTGYLESKFSSKFVKE